MPLCRNYSRGIHTVMATYTQYWLENYFFTAEICSLCYITLCMWGDNKINLIGTGIGLCSLDMVLYVLWHAPSGNHLHKQHCAALPADRARVISTCIRLRLHTDSHGTFCNKQVLMLGWTLWSWNRASLCRAMPHGLAAVTTPCKGVRARMRLGLQHPKWNFCRYLTEFMVIRKQMWSPKLEAINVKENGFIWGTSLKFL